jgi:hypothetical protein
MDQPTTELDGMDPTTGLTLLSEDRLGDSPEQKRKRMFWKYLFEQQIAWDAGDTLAVARGVHTCKVLREPLPRWLADAVLTFIDRRLTAAEWQRQYNLAIHTMRWQAVKESRARGLPWGKCWSDASNMLSGTGAAGGKEAVRTSYKLIQRRRNKK